MVPKITLGFWMCAAGATFYRVRLARDYAEKAMLGGRRVSRLAGLSARVVVEGW
jgi:hypothetical protein